MLSFDHFTIKTPKNINQTERGDVKVEKGHLSPFLGPNIGRTLGENCGSRRLGHFYYSNQFLAFLEYFIPRGTVQWVK